jgi:hypothetical protein
MAKYYLSGPIAALDPMGNKPSQELMDARKKDFFRVQEILSAGRVREVTNPVEIEACGKDYWFCDGAVTGEHDWMCYLRYDLREVVMSNYIVLLEGWHRSPGALLELHVGLLVQACPLFWRDSLKWYQNEPVGAEALEVFEREMKRV